MNGSRFRKAWTGTRLTSDESRRQGSVVKAAVAALPDTEAVRNFLNSHHPGLQGRPLELATGSDAGLQAVETALGVEAGAIKACPPGEAVVAADPGPVPGAGA
jgi:uncharacterized protein (DUF2384 family)